MVFLNVFRIAESSSCDQPCFALGWDSLEYILRILICSLGLCFNPFCLEKLRLYNVIISYIIVYVAFAILYNLSTSS
jgi:hypothetical protein